MWICMPISTHARLLQSCKNIFNALSYGPFSWHKSFALRIDFFKLATNKMFYGDVVNLRRGIVGQHNIFEFCRLEGATERPQTFCQF